MAVTDASFTTSLFHADDANHAAAWEWDDASGVRGEELVAPTILLTEVWAAFSRTLDLPDLGRAICRGLIDRNIVTLLPVTDALALRAGEVTADTRLKGCDSIYVALAAELDDVLVTFDAEQFGRGAGMIRVFRPGAPTSP